MIGLTNILTLKPSEWKTMLQHCVQNIRVNFKEGKMQNGKSGLQYKPGSYKLYKSLGMKRLTKTKVKKESTTGIEYLGRKQVYHKTSTGYGMSNTMRQKIGTSSKLKAFYAKGIESTQTAFVDMTLSGDLKKGLKVKSVNSQGGVVGYESEDSMKIEGNRRYGREVVGLNEENQEKLKKEIIEIFQKNAQTLLAKDIKIQVTI